MNYPYVCVFTGVLGFWGFGVLGGTSVIQPLVRLDTKDPCIILNVQGSKTSPLQRIDIISVAVILFLKNHHSLFSRITVIPASIRNALHYLGYLQLIQVFY